jgi:hypothetical protein
VRVEEPSDEDDRYDKKIRSIRLVEVSVLSRLYERAESTRAAYLLNKAIEPNNNKKGRDGNNRTASTLNIYIVWH